MLVDKMFKKSSEKYPHREAIVSNGKRFTYSEIETMVNQLSSSLMENGVRKGDRVAVLSRNTYEAVVSYYAILNVGAVEVALNVTTDSKENIANKLNNSSPKVLIFNSVFLRLLPLPALMSKSIETVYIVGQKPQAFDFTGNVISFEDVFKKNIIKNSVDAAGLNDLAIVAYTSGTSGLIRGVMATHANIISGACAMLEDMEGEENDKTLTLIPLYHAYGKAVLNSRLLKGSTVFFIDNISFPAEILKLIQTEGITGIVGVPTIFKMILKALKGNEKFDLSTVKYISTGGSKMPEDTFIEVWKAFGNIKILSGYGLTETCGKICRKIFLGEPEVKTELNSCGKIISNHSIDIVGEDGVSVKNGQLGEVVLNGPSVMKGYWGNIKETNEVLKDGWFYTGDLGMIDEKGELYLLDRKKDIIKFGGELIAPKEIEIVINSHPGVQESAVIGVADELMGERIKAFIVLNKNKNVNEEDMKLYCAKFLPISKIPFLIDFVTSLPKSSLDKVKKSELRNTEISNNVQ